MANEAIGSLQKRGYGRESAYGTAVTPDLWMGYVQDFTDNTEMNNAELAGSGSQEVAQLVPLQLDTKGSFDTVLQDGRVLANIFNSRAITGSPTYTHTLVHNDGSGANPSVTLENSHVTAAGSTYVYRFRGSKFEKLTLTCDINDLLHAQVDYVAKAPTASGNTAASITASTSAPYTYAGGTISVAGTAVAELRTAEVTITQALAPQHYQASGTDLFLIGALPEVSRRYEGKLTVSQADNTFYQRFLGRGGANAVGTLLASGAGFNMEYRWRKISGTGLDNSDYISVVLSGCRLTNVPPAGGLDDIQTQELNIKAEDLTMVVVDALSGTNYY